MKTTMTTTTTTTTTYAGHKDFWAPPPFRPWSEASVQSFICLPAHALHAHLHLPPPPAITDSNNTSEAVNVLLLTTSTTRIERWWWLGLWFCTLALTDKFDFPPNPFTLCVAFHYPLFGFTAPGSAVGCQAIDRRNQPTQANDRAIEISW